ncbi:hypothetical protein FIBSPDRAFT_1003946 [Athelia psychrophila]|uniref:Uncharacterized protein n=1 Tax=Athelia psychrophila TaxID=1759441 RepID=A0A167W6Z8_9AGAM|nr:hypothetical protein FIBSPDRAFT_1003946 [Fibularhizoctonia sp. CBS 109695]
MDTLEIRQRRTHGPLASVSQQELIYYLALPILIGFMASTVLWGSLCAQGMLYLRRHSKDVIRVKACVNHMLAAAGSGAFLYDFTWHVYHADYIPAGSETPHHARLALVVSIVRYVWIMWIRALSQSSLETWVASAMLYITVAEAAKRTAFPAFVPSSTRVSKRRARMIVYGLGTGFLACMGSVAIIITVKLAEAGGKSAAERKC